MCELEASQSRGTKSRGAASRGAVSRGGEQGLWEEGGESWLLGTFAVTLAAPELGINCSLALSLPFLGGLLSCHCPRTGHCPSADATRAVPLMCAFPFPREDLSAPLRFHGDGPGCRARCLDNTPPARSPESHLQPARLQAGHQS